MKNSASLNRGGFCIYCVGLPCSGKSFLINGLAEKFAEVFPHKKITVFDADVVRKNIYPKLGFSKEYRSMNVRCIGYLASLVVANNEIALVANIAPFEEDRLHNRQPIEKVGRYYEVFVKTSVEVCKQRDAKGMYLLAEKGTIKEFTGVSSPFEEPNKPEMVLMGNEEIEKNLEEILKFLHEKKEI